MSDVPKQGFMMEARRASSDFRRVRFLPSGALMALCPREDGAITGHIFSDPCALAMARCPVSSSPVPGGPLTNAREALDYLFFKAPFLEPKPRREIEASGFTAAGAAALRELLRHDAVYFRGEPGCFLAGYTADEEGFTISCLTAEACSLTIRAGDVLMKLGREDACSCLDLALMRDSNRRDADPGAAMVEEEFFGLDGDVRVFLDFAKNGGAVLRFSLVTSGDEANRGLVAGL